MKGFQMAHQTDTFARLNFPQETEIILSHSFWPIKMVFHTVVLFTRRVVDTRVFNKTQIITYSSLGKYNGPVEFGLCQ
jgi:hypothetical protein